MHVSQIDLWRVLVGFVFAVIGYSIGYREHRRQMRENVNKLTATVRGALDDIVDLCVSLQSAKRGHSSEVEKAFTLAQKIRRTLQTLV